MKRCVTFILLILLLGVIANVLVAWGCALWASSGNLGRVPIRDRTVLDRVVGIPSDTSLASRWDAGAGVTTYTFQWHIPGQSNAVLMLDAGWPLPSLYGQVDIGGAVHNAVPAPKWFRPRTVMTMPRPIPLRPLARGFIINSLIGAAAFWIVIVPPRLARRHWRRRTGRCPACGYDLRGTDHERCPECGGGARSDPESG